MTRKQKARQQIDRQLEQTCRIVQAYRQMNITAGLGVAVQEFPLTTGDADYILFADAKAIGVVDLPPQEIADDLLSALEEFTAIAEKVKG